MHPRHITPRLTDALSDTPMVLINGARQSGKSTLALAQTSSTGAPRQYLTLDDAVVLNAAKSGPTGFVNGLQGAVTLDEVQRVPELFLAIKAAVDRQRPRQQQHVGGARQQPRPRAWLPGRACPVGRSRPLSWRSCSSTWRSQSSACRCGTIARKPTLRSISSSRTAWARSPALQSRPALRWTAKTSRVFVISRKPSRVGVKERTVFDVDHEFFQQFMD